MPSRSLDELPSFDEIPPNVEDWEEALLNIQFPEASERFTGNLFMHWATIKAVDDEVRWS